MDSNHNDSGTHRERAIRRAGKICTLSPRESETASLIIDLGTILESRSAPVEKATWTVTLAAPASSRRARILI